MIVIVVQRDPAMPHSYNSGHLFFNLDHFFSSCGNVWSDTLSYLGLVVSLF